VRIGDRETECRNCVLIRRRHGLGELGRGEVKAVSADFTGQEGCLVACETTGKKGRHR
jgi:hypothetical protein